MMRGPVFFHVASPRPGTATVTAGGADKPTIALVALHAVSEFLRGMDKDDAREVLESFNDDDPVIQEVISCLDR